MILENSIRDSVCIDTSALMNNEKILDKLINTYDVILSIVVIEELDHLKVSSNPTSAMQARKAIKQISKYRKAINYDFNKTISPVFKTSEGINNYNSNDDIIVSVALFHNAYLITNDLNLTIKAQAIGVKCIEIAAEKMYEGYKEVVVDDMTLADFYSKPNVNCFDCITNEYVVIKNNNNEIVDLKKWNGESYVGLYNKNIKSVAFGDKIKPKDAYQKFAIDSLMTNNLSIISGHAGSGKSLLSLVTAMHLIENGKYDRLVILSNPTKAKGATDLGFYTGDMQQKLLQNSIGNILNTKFGDRTAVEILLNQDKIRLVSMADCRGMEIRDNEILYITEAQNTNSELLKLCLSRASVNAKIIIEGDYDAQVDSYAFEGSKNGMSRAIEVLKGEELFGCVTLKNIWRSRVAELVDSM